MIMDNQSASADKKYPKPPPYYGRQSSPSSSPSDEHGSTRFDISEAEWKAKLKTLQRMIRKYNWMRRGDEGALCASMRDLAASHNDPEVQAYWNRRADEFQKASDADKRTVLGDIARGVVALIVAPLAITGFILFATGALIKYSGDVLTGGRASSMSLMKSKKTPAH
ncbi:hypothetical protein B0H15DRAFT_309326 [Mycena belliarum]|uniref:Uncharacterized protein n=1 Tax=Mycena belliarum TaxID=1033014 RepID=A0AAD6XNM2_9AGAR|nr:hypothetical protein B0H15DRAFT_309326 [Mycena belliae]